MAYLCALEIAPLLRAGDGEAFELVVEQHDGGLIVSVMAG
jgi:hypothetical protein